MHLTVRARALAVAMICALALALAVFIPGMAAAQGGDADEAQRIIADQIDAFGRGDGERAFSHAAPGIQAQFGTAEVFMRMVERGYEPVFRPRSFGFTEYRAAGDEAVQMLEVVGPDGAPWVAVYTLARQPDGSWRISGCHLRPGTGA